MKFSTSISICGVLLLAAGCAEPRYGATAPQVISSPPTGSGTATAGVQKAETDRALESQIRQSLGNSNLSYLASRVNVMASSGIVTLSGSVPTAQDRQALETTVRNTSGVNSVIDQVRVQETEGTPGTTTPVYSETSPGQATTPETDSALTDRLQQTLRNNANTAPLAQDVNVSTQNGVVTLTGTVPSEQQRQLLDNLVRNVSGVKSVYDQMRIAAAATGRVTQEPRSYSTPSGSGQGQLLAGGNNATAGDIFSLHVQGLNETDRNLAQQILQGLKNDSTLASLFPSVNINVSGGRVVLQGLVETQQQKQAIGSVVERAAGGSNVVNQLRVNRE